MNEWIRLLAALDHTFGFKDRKKSTFRKVSQTFDARTNEHVVVIDYRVRRGGDRVVTKNRKQKQIGKLKLLSQLAAQARTQGM